MKGKARKNFFQVKPQFLALIYVYSDDKNPHLILP